MKKREIVLLMTALTKGGKTTIAMALCHESCRRKMVSLANCRTEVTVDWTYDSEAEDIALREILLNYKGVFGTDRKEDITCERFADVLDSEDGAYLKIFGLEKQDDLSSAQLETYVLGKITEYVNNCNDMRLAELIKNRKSNRFLRRIKVIVPPVEDFKAFFDEKKITLVLRDTRGLLDMDPDEAKKISFLSMQELGIDRINAVLLLGTTTAFANLVEWYKKAYREAFESVPVFVMTRPDSVATVYDFLYGIDDENVTPEKVGDFLAQVKKGTRKGFKDFSKSFKQCYELLEMFEVGKVVNDYDFNFNYKVYNNEELRYVYPVAETLHKSDVAERDYMSPDYKLYEMMIFSNVKDMVDKIITHETFIEAINKRIVGDFVASIQGSTDVGLCPWYRKYTRKDVCDSIMHGDILGVRDGIVTVNHGKIKYLGAVTSAVSANAWLRHKAANYTYSEELLCDMEWEKDMPKECRDNLVRMALFEIIERNKDDSAHFQSYYFMNRYKVERAIRTIREVRVQDGENGDALSRVAVEIANLVFPEEG